MWAFLPTRDSDNLASVVSVENFHSNTSWCIFVRELACHSKFHPRKVFRSSCSEFYERQCNRYSGIYPRSIKRWKILHSFVASHAIWIHPPGHGQLVFNLDQTHSHLFTSFEILLAKRLLGPVSEKVFQSMTFPFIHTCWVPSDSCEPNNFRVLLPISLSVLWFYLCSRYHGYLKQLSHGVGYFV